MTRSTTDRQPPGAAPDGSTLLLIAGPALELIPTAPPRRPARPGAPAPVVPAPAVPAPAAPAPAPAGGTSWLLPLMVLVIGMFMSILDTSIVNIALPSIRRDFGATAESAQWISTAYGLTEGAVVPVSAWLGNRIGQKKLYVWSIALFTVFSALCGISTSITEMVVFRILQAVPGGMIPVTCTILIYRMVPREKIGAAMGLYGVGVVVAPGVGPILGGYFVEYLSWPWIYWVNVPIGVVATLAAVFVLKEQPLVRGKKLDVLGFACIATGLFAFLLALEKGTTWGWTSYSVLGLLALAVNLILLWLVIAQQRENPLLDISVFRNGNFVKSMVLVGVLMVGLFAMLFYLPQFLQSVQGYTPFDTGVLVLPQAVMLITIIPVAGQLYDKIGARWPAVIGLALVGAGLLLLSRINTDIPKWDLIIAQAVVGAGVGVALMPIMTGALAELTLAQRDSGSALNTLIQRVSQSFGIALLTGLMTTNQRQIFADQSSLTYARGVDVTPELEGMVQQGPGGLLSLWQHYGNTANTLGYSQSFTIVGSLALAAVLVAFLLPTGRPAAAEGERPAMH